MESKNVKQLLLMLVILFGPTLISGQSRGEEYRGDGSTQSLTQSQLKGYLQRRLQQGQQPSHYPQQQPNYYQQQSQSQSYSNPPYNPQYYDPPYNPQYQSPAHSPALYNSQPQPQPSYVQQPSPTHNYYPSQSPTQSPQNYNNVQSSQQTHVLNSRIDSRFSPGEVSSPQTPPVEEFASRAPTTNKGPRRPVTTSKPPILTRFDLLGSSEIKKRLMFDDELSSSMDTFALAMLSHFIDDLGNENFMISPFSIYHMLVLIAEGAKGKTFEEINENLKLISPARTRDFQQYLNVALDKNTANVILKKFSMLITDVARPIKPEYENIIEKVYDGDVIAVNFADVDNTLNKINGMVSNLTEGQIQDTVKREDLFKAQLILISGLFFKGQWMNVFNTTFTKREPFFDTNGQQTGQVNMMFQRGPFAYSAVADIGCHVLELPYADLPQTRNDIPGSGLSMILVLPRKGLSLSDAAENVYRHSMDKIYQELRSAKEDFGDDEVEVHLPRFQISTAKDLRGTLETYGIKDIFDQSADLSGINNRYFVSAMIHNTKISVDEKGTTAAAVTTSIFANKATPPKFHANKPFLFFIVDKVTKIILFSGQYATPQLY